MVHILVILLYTFGSTLSYKKDPAKCIQHNSIGHNLLPMFFSQSLVYFANVVSDLFEQVFQPLNTPHLLKTFSTYINVVLGSLKFNFSPVFVNRKLVFLPPVGILNLVMFI